MTHLETTWHDQDPPKGQDPAKSMDVSQVFLSARSAFQAYPGCLYPISVFPGFIRRSRKIFPPPLCGRLVLLDARKAGEGLPMGTQVSNSRLTVVLRSQVLDRRDRLRLLWILTPQPAGLTDYFNPVRAIIVDPSLERSLFRPPSRISFSQQQHVRTVYPSALSSWKSFGKIISPIHNI